MANLRLLVFMLVLPAFLSAHELNSRLLHLDSLLSQQERFTETREATIHSLQILNSRATTLTQKYQFLRQLCAEYIPYNIDSALHYAGRCVEVAHQLPDGQLTLEANLQLAQSMLLAGMYHEAGDLLDVMDVKSMDDDLRVVYYTVNSTRYRYMQAYLAGTVIHQNYNKMRAAYQDSLLALLNPSSVDYPVVLAERKLDSNEDDAAKVLLEEALAKRTPEEHAFAYTAYSLSNVFGRQGDRMNQMRYLALSAESDIRSAVRENMALRELALLLYESGDIERAYRYIKVALNDALFSKARLRTFEILEILPLIDHAYLDLRERKRQNMVYFTWIVSLLSLFLMLSLFFNQKQKQKLNRANNEIKSINTQLSEVNEQLKASNLQVASENTILAASNQMQEEHIARYLKLCSSYIGKMDQYRNTIHKKAAKGSKEELIKLLKSKEFIDRELKSFYADFDHAFLELYPGFVEQFNYLLRDDEQMVVKSGELLNTELRIFALIRLGITESPQIAEFLRYSVTTIYNYRTKVRNKARITRDNFENEVMKLGISG